MKSLASLFFSVLWLGLAVVRAVPAQDTGTFLPVKAIVTGKGDLANSAGVIATILAEVPERQRYSSLGGFDKGDRVALEITARTRIETRVGGKRAAAGLGALVKGCTIEFRDYDEVLQSEPAIISPRTVIITEPGK